MKTITLYSDSKRTKFFSVRFDYDLQAIKKIRMIGGVWNESMQSWQFEKSKKNVSLIQNIFSKRFSVQNDLQLD